jgi:hypothetical protein
MESSTDLLTARQVISALLARPALRKVAATCVLPAVKHGNEWLYRKADLDAWLAKQESGSVPQECACSPS